MDSQFDDSAMLSGIERARHGTKVSETLSSGHSRQRSILSDSSASADPLTGRLGV